MCVVMESFAFLNEDMQHCKVRTGFLHTGSTLDVVVGAQFPLPVATECRDEVPQFVGRLVHSDRYYWN